MYLYYLLRTRLVLTTCLCPAGRYAGGGRYDTLLREAPWKFSHVLTSKFSLLMENALADTTKLGYSSAQRRYLDFCHKHSISPLPSQGDFLHNLLGFVVWLTLPSPTAPQGLRYSSIKTYLSGVRDYIISAGYPSPLTPSNSPVLERLLRGVKKNEKPVGSKPRLPITLGLLRLMKSYVSTPVIAMGNTAKFSRSLWALLTIAVHLLLRLGECATTPTTPPAGILRVNNVTKVTDTHYQLRLHTSKTDIFRAGVTLNLFATGSPVCPVEALISLDLSRDGKSPLFPDENNQPLKASQVRELIPLIMASVIDEHKLNLNPLHFNGHSLRKGGATSLYAAGVPTDLIRTIGRWRSWCFRLYTETSVEQVRQAMRDASNSAACDYECVTRPQPYVDSAFQWVTCGG
jgi:hypothetical protein